MMTSEKVTLQHEINTAIDRSIDYLAQRQLHNGEFITYMAPDDVMQEWCVPDSVTVITALIGTCLLPFQNRPQVDRVLTKATGFLSYQMMRGGVWQYFTRWHHLYKYLPPDTDDTVLIASLLKARKVPFPDHIELLLMNRAKDGRFYTWFTIHSNFLSYSGTFWRLIARELKSPVKTLLYWTQRDHRRNDIDVIVNSNIITYLGDTEVTKPAIRYIVDVINQNKEAGSDKWYLNPIVFYYFLSRLFLLNIPELKGIQGIVAERIFKAIQNSRHFDDCDLEIALSISALLHTGCRDDRIHGYAARLLALQQQSGAWRRHELASGPAKILVWGCEEATTALCIEALHLYQNQLSGK